ncbi:MAG: hypothetical protein VX740_05565 [Pseudomonadota bacterium]|jgi:uncharacterized membrane protein (DUF485 family)|nr:hypothetical protein [Alphaproteobacteria bacterium]MED5422890.1 hypothetical protein [Pseudomonadota bacterium]
MQSDASSSALSLKFRHHKERAHRLKAIIFAVSIVFVLAYFAFTIYTHSGPIVLGTEMNGNGQVEYMCIGRSCEDLGANFSWKDQ